jgi:MinD-like ATPase involved in chromosome partitioning or flagellar assembly
MAAIALASVKGSPGVTAAALALAACWRGSSRTVLIECDPAGGDLAARLGVPATPGLVGLAAAVRRAPDVDEVWRHAHALAGGGPSVVLAPAGAEQAAATVRALAGSKLVDALARAPDVAAVVDCGRIDPASATVPVAGQASCMLACLRPRRDELAQPGGGGRRAARAARCRPWC